MPAVLDMFVRGSLNVGKSIEKIEADHDLTIEECISFTDHEETGILEIELVTKQFWLILYNNSDDIYYLRDFLDTMIKAKERNDIKQKENLP